MFFIIAGQVGAQVYMPPLTQRVDSLLDSNWRFILQDVAGAQAPDFDDSSWTNLNLPHTWNNLDGQDGGNNYYRGVGWYRSHFTPDASETNNEFFLKFDGAFLVADVWVNGNFLGEHQGGFAAFVFDATPFINLGADNVIAVRANNAFNADVPPLNADFTFFGGLYRDVHLLVTAPVQVSPLDYGSPGIYLATTDVSSNSADLEVTAVVSNATATAQDIIVRTVVTDAATNMVAALTNELTLPAQSVSNVITSSTIMNPHLWNGLGDPYLYQTFTEVWAGTNLLDVVAQPLGIRSFYVDPTNGFFLNGQPYDLHGVNLHQDWLNCGWALTNAQRDTNFMFLKEIGATFLRLSHYEHNDYTYQLADQNGLCVWSEVPVIDYITESPAFYTNTLQQLREMIRQRYNHPSVVCWSVYNEITRNAGPVTTNLINQEVQLVAQEDPTRFSTAASTASDGDPSTLYTQLIAFNQYYGWYLSPLNGIGAWADNIHSNYPNRCIGVSEYGAGGSIYQHSENPSFPTNTGTSFHPEEWQDLVIETNWQVMAARPFLWCKLVWTSFDFASDGRDEGDTPGRNDKGLVTFDRQVCKDAFYYFQANWTTNPMVYITGHTFTNRLTNVITAKVYANCDSVELFVNGTSQGGVTSSNCIFTWPVSLSPGANNVLAVGIKGASNVTDSLTWVFPVRAPAVAITNPSISTLYLSDTNEAVWLAASATDLAPGVSPPLTFQWSQTGGPGKIAFTSTNALTTEAHFDAAGVYTVVFQATKDDLTSSAGLTVVEDEPYGPALMVQFAFDDAGPGTTTPSDTNNGGVTASLNMYDATGTAADYHGAANSGVAGLTTGSRALDFSENPGQGGSGPVAAVTNAALGFGMVTNFTATLWFNQSVQLTNNIGPRLFILGNSTNTDCGTPDSIGMKFQDASNLWFYVGTNLAVAAFDASLPLNTWTFVAMSYDGTNVSLYEGTDQAAVVLVGTTPAAGLSVSLGAAASLEIGNRLNQDRDFAGWLADFRFYTGAGNLDFVESIRQAASGPAGLMAAPGDNQVALSWDALLGAASYNLKRATVSGGPYTVISTAGTITGTACVDSTATNGMTYYYVVSAATSISPASETANSPTEAVATLPTPPVPPVASYNNPMYAGMTLYLTASTISGATYNWNGPNGFTSGSRDPAIPNADPTVAGIYSVTAMVGGVTSSPGTVSVTVNPPLMLSAQMDSGQLVFDWPFGTLQSATNLLGPWNNVSGATAPFTNATMAPQEFYRIQSQ